MYLQTGRASVESQAKMLRVLMVGAGSRARRALLALAVAVGIALAAAPMLAHHSRALFDMGKNITYRGVVEEYRWQNPPQPHRRQSRGRRGGSVNGGDMDRRGLGYQRHDLQRVDSEDVQAWRSDYGGGSPEYEWVQPRVALLRDQG